MNAKLPDSRICKFIILVVFTGIIPRLLDAQAVDNAASFRMMPVDQYVRLHYENDFFTGHDLYYTQGINLEFVNPRYRTLFLTRTLVTPAGMKSNFGISLEHNGYTPSSITHHNILYGDRPFAADLFVKIFSFSSDSSRRLRITSSMSLGIVGSIASGYWMQKTIHRWLNGTPPEGWENQIRNDAVINYEAGIEKNLLRARNCFLLNGTASARIGSLSDKATIGFVLMIGRLNRTIAAAFSGWRTGQAQDFALHAYVQPLVSVVGYDATLQGGLFDRKSPYTISAANMTRITWQANYGIACTFHSITAEYFKSAISKEFNSGGNHRWGGIRLGVRI